MRILLAEDDEMSQKVALAMLNRLGYKADKARNGLEVLDALEHQSYDLILMNLGMPQLDGLDTTSEIRKRWQNGPRIVAVTARVLPEIREQCFEVGMDGFIGKPVKLGDLAKVMDRLHAD